MLALSSDSVVIVLNFFKPIQMHQEIQKYIVKVQKELSSAQRGNFTRCPLTRLPRDT